ncbi:unnamed protein product [Eruca vesicaria subsp. sativa]|uniref:SRR1-like domain-containing protein n=1 Tax=Eruca vesicaria subsp. sativa TaxID=29727 RepID=A0ABC8M3W3_ERUVS|nr:unnamed protein product [Eruca vesicaria subsp. sativa]
MADSRNAGNNIPDSSGAWTEETHARTKREGNDLEIDPERQERLKQQMEISLKTIENSEFYKSFLKQLTSPEVSSHIQIMLGSETQLQMVIYGLGSIESDDENPRFQLSIAILMKREFDWSEMCIGFYGLYRRNWAFGLYLY